ncbi:CZB domain-containing protein [Vibrio sp. DNF-1]|nr:CZB domain-containing protein [Vibrio salinus]
MQNAYIGLENNGEGEEAQATKVDHFSCRLGKWYYEGDGLNNYNSLPAYQNLEIHHKDVHSHIHQALHLVQNDWMNQDDIFDQLIQTVSNAEHASGQVIENISRLVEQKHPNH